MSRYFLLVFCIVIFCDGSRGLGISLEDVTDALNQEDSLKNQIEQLKKNLSSVWSSVSDLRQNVEHDLHQLHLFQMEVKEKLQNFFGMQIKNQGKDMHHMHKEDTEHSDVADHPTSHHGHFDDHHHDDYHHGDHHDDHHDDHHGNHHDDHHGDHHDDYHHGDHHDDYHHGDPHHGDHHDDHHGYPHHYSSDDHSHEEHHDNHENHHDDSHHNDSSHQQKQSSDHSEHHHGQDHQKDHDEHGSHDSAQHNHSDHHDSTTQTSHSHSDDHSEHKDVHNTTHNSHQQDHHHESHHVHHHHHHDHTSHSESTKFDFAICNVMPNRAIPDEKQQNITGRIRLWQKENGTLHIHLQLEGFKMDNHQHHVSGDQTPQKHTHGFHVHRDGDLSNGCQSTGPHYNPLEVVHGGPKSPVRHVGDLGNIECDEHGVTNVVITDEIASLQGPYSIIGKSLVVHEDIDDFGINPDIPESVSSGNAGTRIACCIIEKVDRLPPPIRKKKRNHSHHHHSSHH